MRILPLLALGNLALSLPFPISLTKRSIGIPISVKTNKIWATRQPDDHEQVKRHSVERLSARDSSWRRSEEVEDSGSHGWIDRSLARQEENIAREPETEDYRDIKRQVRQDDYSPLRRVARPDSTKITEADPDGTRVTKRSGWEPNTVDPDGTRVTKRGSWEPNDVEPDGTRVTKRGEDGFDIVKPDGTRVTKRGGDSSDTVQPDGTRVTKRHYDVYDNSASVKRVAAAGNNFGRSEDDNNWKRDGIPSAHLQHGGSLEE